MRNKTSSIQWKIKHTKNNFNEKPIITNQLLCTLLLSSSTVQYKIQNMCNKFKINFQLKKKKNCASPIKQVCIVRYTEITKVGSLFKN